MNCKLSISKSKIARIFYIYLKVVQMLKRGASRCGMSPLYAMKDNSSPISELIYIGICRTVDDDFVRVSA